MTKLSSAWLRLVASSFVFVGSAAFAATPTVIDPVVLETVKGSAAQSGAAASGQFGSKAAFMTNLSLPITSPTQMKTIDGSTSFNAQLSFPSSNRFLEVFVQPSATGDLSTVIAGEDLDMNGSIDYSFQLPFPVSGVCANGIIGCTPGSWSNCNYYEWTATTEGKVSLLGSSALKLGGCYCINTSCGSNLVWTNLSHVLKDLGGGMVGAIQKTNPSFTISDVAIEGTKIAYSGQDLSRPPGEGGAPSLNPPAPPAQMTYYQSPMSISGAVQTTTTGQAGDPQSLYSLVTSFDPQRQQIPCVDKRIVSLYKSDISEVIEPVGGTGSIQYCGVDCINIILGTTEHNKWAGNCTIFEEDYRVLVKQPELIESATLAKTIFDDYMQVWIDGEKVWYGPNANFPPETVGACENSTDGEAFPDLDITPTFKRNGEVSSKIRVSVGGRGDGYALIRIKLKLNECTVMESIQDGCSTLNGRPECRLQEEKVDGVSTIRNSNPTGLIVLPSAKTIMETGCDDALLTRDWWHKEKVFFCDSTGYDFSDATKRFGTVINSMQTTGMVTDYQDTIKSPTGSWSELSGTVSLMATDSVADCEMACKTRKAKVDTQATVLGTSSQFQADPQNYDIIYHTCNSNGLCPVEAGAEIVKDCQCLNEFSEAASVMQMLRLGSQDAICSDGVPKPLSSP